VRSIRVFAKNMGDPYYEPTIVVHGNCYNSYGKIKAVGDSRVEKSNI